LRGTVDVITGKLICFDGGCAVDVLGLEAMEQTTEFYQTVGSGQKTLAGGIKQT
jgi:hypothetical protein